MPSPSVHIPVLVDPIVEWLAPTAPGLLVDATLGLGGHAMALLTAAPGFQLLGVDRDPEAVAEARRRLEPYGHRVTVIAAKFDRIPDLLVERELESPSAILADLGCSSLQLDSPERGFSFAADGPLDMRMGADGATAAELVNMAAGLHRRAQPAGGKGRAEAARSEDPPRHPCLPGVADRGQR